MKKLIMAFSLCLCFMFFACACTENVTETEEYHELESENQYLSDQVSYFEDEIYFKDKNIALILKTLDNNTANANIQTFRFGDMWSVGDYFHFSFAYSKKDNALIYNIKDKENEPLIWIDGECENVQNLFVCFLRSDGTIETSDSFIGDEVNAISIPDYNYEYDVYLFASVNGQIYSAKYNFSCNDIK